MPSKQRSPRLLLLVIILFSLSAVKLNVQPKPIRPRKLETSAKLVDLKFEDERIKVSAKSAHRWRYSDHGRETTS